MSQSDWGHISPSPILCRFVIESYKQALLEQQQDMDKPPKYLLGKELTYDDVREILYRVQARVDAEQGINWYQIEYYLNEHFKEMNDEPN